MFDELDKQNTTPRSPLSGGIKTPMPPIHKPVDIFSEVDKTPKPEALRPKGDNPLPAPGTVIPAEDGWLKNKMIIFSFIFGGLIIVIGGGYLGLKLMVKKEAPVDTEIVGEINNNQVEPEVPAPAAEKDNNVVDQPIKPEVIQPIDSDKDGLTDEEELILGTSINDIDTDQDDLTDREEAKVYGTDPLKADTDGDGYADGEEVKNGFNPKGPGKLLDINNQE